LLYKDAFLSPSDRDTMPPAAPAADFHDLDLPPRSGAADEPAKTDDHRLLASDKAAMAIVASSEIEWETPTGRRAHLWLLPDGNIALPVCRQNR
jgi:hypothetical protein